MFPGCGASAGCIGAPSSGGGGASGTVSLSNITLEDALVSPNNPSCGFTLGTTGGITYTGNSNSLTPATWGSGVTGSEYEARLTATSGGVTSGTLATWLSLGSALNWTRNRTNDAVGTTSFTGTLEIRRASDQVVVGSCTVNMSATVEA